MTDMKNPAVLVSQLDEKVDLSPQPQEQPEHGCPFSAWCQRWRGNRQEPRSRSHWRIVTRIILALTLFLFIGRAIRAAIARSHRNARLTIHSVEGLMYIYGARQDSIALELYKEFNYIFDYPQDALNLDGYLPRSQVFNFSENPLDYLDYPEDIFPFGYGPVPGFPSIPFDENTVPPFSLEEDYYIPGYYQLDSAAYSPPYDRPPNRRHPNCNDSALHPWIGKTKFLVSPDDFQSVVVSLHGKALPPAVVKIHQSDSDLTEKISIKVSALISNKKFNHLITASAFESHGSYVVEINEPKHLDPKDCIKLKVDITFPAGLSDFGSLRLCLSGARVWAYDLGGIRFGNFDFGAGRGALFSSQINADNIHIGAVKGFIHGRFGVTTNFTVGTISGFSPVLVTPIGYPVHIKATTINGVVAVRLPSDDYEGDFALTTVWARTVIKAPNPSDIHIKKLTPNIKAGYYKEKTDNKIYISATHGLANLTFV